MFGYWQEWRPLLDISTYGVTDEYTAGLWKIQTVDDSLAGAGSYWV